MKTNRQSNSGIASQLKWGVALLLVAGALGGVWLSGWGRHHHRRKLTPEQELSAFEKRLSNSGEPNSKQMANLLNAKSQAVLDTTLATEERNYLEHETYLERQRRDHEPREAEHAGHTEDGHRPSAAVSKVSCFRAGCMSNVTFSDGAYASAIQEHLLINPDSEFRKWPGTAYFGPLVPDGKGGIKTIWALLIEPRKIDELRGAIASLGEGSGSSKDVVVNIGTEKGEN